MIIEQTSIPGVFLVTPQKIEDERGFFARTVCAEQLSSYGLNVSFVQQSVSFNLCKGTLRGMHYQSEPFAEEKLVRVTSGSIFDVTVDLRNNSPAFMRWYAVELSSENRCSLYIPKGVAHGFLTLSDHSEILYQMTVSYNPESAKGIRWDDPAIDIIWPFKPVKISDRDKTYSLLTDFEQRSQGK